MVDLIFILAPDASLTEVRKVLSENRVDVKQLLEELGMILGEAEDCDLEKLRSMPQFLSVDVDTPVQIAPPDSPLQ
ncbi:hypothetical protein OZN62_12150 [Aurantiacibacter sp. MUD11]|uniref:hypothetical protein n=1 Tax=Aurantiacibacter sp. MUD11 TaxID=3003265 RepID=UPI0022AA93CB|nr:hypothetical protein [Aurantiacibacter sp. MUD11]WAT17654.1 hypothetical protein OZN62_12150 [Aurantiacibacter sp. MUD11]